jgi:hypothetical protein
MWDTPVSIELTITQRQAVTKKKALAHRSADRVASRLRPGGVAGRVDAQGGEAQGLAVRLVRLREPSGWWPMTTSTFHKVRSLASFCLKTEPSP